MNQRPEKILNRTLLSRTADSMIQATANRWKGPAAAALLIALASLVLVRGVVPALTRIDSDFPNYFTAARVVAEGGSAERLYDDSWFQQQIRRELPGVDARGKFGPFPPPTALLLVPLARLSPLTALRVTTAVSLLCLLCSIWLLARIVPLGLVESAVLVLLSGYAVCNGLRLGQPYIAVSTACILGYYAWLKGRPLLAGACFGIFAPIKYVPGLILIYFALRRQWKVALSGVAAAAAVVLVGIAVLGWKVHRVFLDSVLGNHLAGNLSMQDPFTASFQSFDSLFRRLFVFDATANPHPWLALPGLQIAAVAITKATLLAVAVATLLRLTRSNPENSVAPSVGLLGILVLLIAPATATYHFVLLWLPVGLLISHFRREGALLYAWLILGLYSLIGFLPYGRTARFEGRGGLTVLAYPRLFLLLAMFSVCVYFVWSRARSTEPAAATLT
jgi:hypothetical protein